MHTLPKTTLAQVLELHRSKKLVGVFNLSNDDYHASPGVSKSTLDNIAVSPKYFQWTLKNQKKQTKPMLFGAAYHCLILEAHLYASLFYETKTQPNEPEMDAQDRWPISAANFKTLSAMREEFQRDEIAMKSIDGHRELSFFWTDRETGIQCKCKLDIVLLHGIIVDLKTSEDAAQDEFSKTMMNYRYEVQAAWGLDGVRLSLEQSGQDLGIQMPDTFMFSVQEKLEPYDIGFHKIGPNSLVKGEELYRRDLETYARCVTDGIWPGKTKGKIMETECPIWHLTRIVTPT